MKRSLCACRILFIFMTLCITLTSFGADENRIRLEEATKYFTCWNLEKSMQLCKEVLASNPTPWERAAATFGLGSNLLEKVLTFDHPEDRPAANPSSSDAQLLLGCMLSAIARARKGSFQESVNSFREALRLDPNNQAAIERLFSTLFMELKEQKQEAMILAEKHKDDPAQPMYFCFSGAPYYLWINSLEGDQSEIALKERMRSVPTDGEAIIQLARYCDHNKRTKESKDFYEKFINDLDRGALSSNDLMGRNRECSALYHLANFQFQNGEAEKALANYERIMVISPAYPDVKYNIAIINMQQALPYLKKAQESFDRAIQQNRRGAAERIAPQLDAVKKMLETWQNQPGRK